MTGPMSAIRRVEQHNQAFSGSGVMPDKARRDARHKQHALEVEQSQAALRKSIAETERLVTKSDEMLERHRRERESDEEER